MTTQSYDLRDASQLVQFWSDCNQAKNKCPQALCWNLPARTSIAECFAILFRDDVLWGGGYSKYLSEQAKGTFKRYALFRDGSCIDTITNTTHKQSETFTIIIKVAKKTC